MGRESLLKLQRRKGKDEKHVSLGCVSVSSKGHSMYVFCCCRLQIGDDTFADVAIVGKYVGSKEDPSYPTHFVTCWIRTGCHVLHHSLAAGERKMGRKRYPLDKRSNDNDEIFS